MFIRPDSIGICGLFPLHGDPDPAIGGSATTQSLRSGFAGKKGTLRVTPLNGKISVPHASLLPHGSSLITHPFLPLCVLCASAVSPLLRAQISRRAQEWS